MDNEFKAIWVHKTDHKIFIEYATDKGLKGCSAFKKIMKKIFPKRYEVK